MASDATSIRSAEQLARSSVNARARLAQQSGRLSWSAIGDYVIDFTFGLVKLAGQWSAFRD